MDLERLTVILDASSAKLKTGLATADKQMSAFSKVAALRGKAAGNAFSSALALGAAAGITILVAVAGNALFKLGEKFEKVQFIIRRTTGAIGKDLKNLEQSFKNVYKQSAASSEVVAQAMSDLNARTNLTGAALEKLTKQELELSTITRGDVSETVRQTTRMFGDWSIATDKQAESLDWLYKINQQTGISIAQLAEQVTWFGAPLRQLGYDWETATTMIGRWEKEGVNITTLFSGMRMSLKYFAREGVGDTAKAFAEVIEEIKGMDDAAGRLRAVQVFGVRAATDMFAAIKEGRYDVQGLVDDLTESKDTIAAARAETTDLGDKLSKMGHSLQVAFEPIAVKFHDAFEKAVGPIVDAIAEGDWGKAGEAVGSAIGKGIAGTIKAAIEALPTIFIKVIPTVVKGAYETGKGIVKETQNLAEEAANYLITHDMAREVEAHAKEEGLSLGSAYQHAIKEGFLANFLGQEPTTLALIQVRDILGLDIPKEDFDRAIAEGFDPEYISDIIARQAQRAQDLAAAKAARLGQTIRLGQGIGMPDYGAMLWSPDEDFAAKWGLLGEAISKVPDAETLKWFEQLGLSEEEVKQYTDDLTSVFDDMTSSEDAWTRAIEKSAKAAGKSTDEFDASKTSMKDYAAELENQIAAWDKYEKNLTTLFARYGDEFSTEVMMEAAKKGPEFVSALLGSDSGTVRRVLQDLSTLIEQDMGKITEDVISASGEEGANTYLDAMYQGIGGATAKKSLSGTVEDELDKIDASPAGESIADQMETAISTAMGGWRLGPVTVPVRFSMGTPVESKAMGGPVGMPKPRRSTGRAVPIIAHEGELVLTENQADWMLGYGMGGLVGYAGGGTVWGAPEQVAWIGSVIESIEDLVAVLKEQNVDDQAFQEAMLDAFDERSALASSYVNRESARYSAQQAEAGDWYDPEEMAAMTATLAREIEFLDKAIIEAQTQLQAAKNAGADPETINELSENLSDLQGNAADAQAELRKLADVPLDQSLALWNERLQQTDILMGVVGIGAELTEEKLSLLASTYETAMQEMAEGVDPLDIAAHATEAMSALADMMQTEVDALDDALGDATQAVDDAQDEWEDAWQARVDAVEKAQKDELDALDQQTDNINEKYDEQIEAIEENQRELREIWEEADRAAALADIQGDLQDILGEGYFTEEDVRRIEELNKQLAREKQQQSRDLQMEILEKEKEQLEKARETELGSVEDARKQAEERYGVIREALDQERDLQIQHFEDLRKSAQDAYDQELAALKLKYATMLGEVRKQQEELLKETANYHEAGRAIGEAFAAGLESALESVRAAAEALGQVVKDNLQGNSPPKEGPLSDMDTWWSAFPQTLLKPFDIGPAFDKAVGASLEQPTIVHRHDVILSGEGANERHLPELARLIAGELRTDVETVKYSYGRRGWGT